MDNIRALLGVLDRPDRAFPSVHVAGTNGKGSVAAMIDAMLGAAGVRSGLFTSPHLLRPEERIRIGGRDIDSAELHRQLAGVRAAIENASNDGRLRAHPSFFEVITATALCAFRDRRVRAAVLEVGLGGRLDATNAVEADVGVVVSIDLDHTKTLGSTLEAIAFEKAGIVKPGMPVVSGVVQQGAIEVLARACAEREAVLVDARVAARLVAEDGDGFTLLTRRGRYPGLRSALAGRHQIDNARVALVAFELFAERLGVRPRAEAVRAALAAVRWPGRLQRLDPGDGRAALLLDGAHNPSGFRALSVHLAARGLPPPVALVGMTGGRPVAPLLGPLVGRVERFVLTRPPVERAVDPARLGEEASGVTPRFEIVPEPAAALERARELAGPDGEVLVTGSLYLVGAVLGLLERDGEEAPGPLAL